MTIRLTDLMNDVLPYTPGCPNPVVRRELRKSAQRFCRETMVLQIDVEPITVAAGVTDVDLTLYCPSQTRPVKAIEVNVDGRVVASISKDGLRTLNPQYQQAAAGTVQRYFAKNEDAITLFPAPALDSVVRLTLAICPTDNAQTFPDELGGLWRNAIVGGAIQRICAVPGQPYTSMELANMGAAWYYDGTTRASTEFQNSFGRGTRVTMRPLA